MESKSVTGEKDLVSKKFTLGAVNVHLRRFAQHNKHQTAKCKKLTKANVQTEWPVWKAAILAKGPSGWKCIAPPTKPQDVFSSPVKQTFFTPPKQQK